ncbi:PLP-dependent aminotransferase family protein [Archangium violaceum]|uniref:MocR-like pyridoxine biosynthesis transcription factor PdxR n=1 Tax=Archangium violaceum TaxID=83451 RepID=UPI00194FADB2|nr:PLP-dependent aminotransferase family protein [Archangium violaceum]QRN92907.1 PLP-dependent aminotransferase family protein [Archangium violaceum]
MKGWDLPLDLHAPSPTPLFVRIARALEDDIRRGRLPPGSPLPGSRTLAESLGVHRNTVLAAYRELETQGWIATSAARATFVSPTLPDVPARPVAGAPRAAMPSRVGFALPAAAPLRREHPEPPRGTIVLAGGVPDIRLLPAALLARAYRRALKLHGNRVLGYGDPNGHPRLRAALADMLSSLRGLAVSADDLVITRGSQGALDLVARTLLRPGDTVAVETPGYRPAWHALQLAGARLVPVPVDAEGLSVEALASLSQRTPVRAVYLTPHHQYPTTVTLSPARRLALLAWAREHRVALIEDDYDHEFHYEGRPVLPLASADRDGLVLYVGTLSKVLAPALRLGFLAAPPPFLEHALGVREAVDRQGDTALEAAVAELLEEGEVQRHVRKMRGVYRDRRDALVEALARELPDVLTVSPPAGGMALWAHCAPEVDAAAWSRAGLEEGVSFTPGSVFGFDERPVPAVRLGFAARKESELAEAVRRMVRALATVTGTQRQGSTARTGAGSRSRGATRRG